ncbi:MAG: hypothetical protein QM723_20335 [Myxococcaceae bacterium]
MRKAPALFVAVSLLSLIGCKKKEEAPPPEAKPAAPAAPAKTSPDLPLMDKMAFEAAHRTDAGLSVDDFFAALDKAGLKVTDVKQHVAGVYGARYCSGGMTAGVHVDLCEFDSDKDAEGAKVATDKAFGSVPNLQHLSHKASMLSVRPETVTPETEATVRKVTDTFNAQ